MATAAACWADVASLQLDPTPNIALGLGSNVGDRREALNAACDALEARQVHILRRSRMYLTRPWGISDQPAFLNAALLVETAFSPMELLQTCLEVERALGRERLVKWGPRRIDIDILFYGSTHIKTESLELPHPWLTRRDFVLAPVLDLLQSPHAASGLPDFRAALDALPLAERSIESAEAW